MSEDKALCHSDGFYQRVRAVQSINMFKHSLSTLNSCSRRLLSVQQTSGYDWTKLEKISMEPFEYIQKLPCKQHTLIAPSFNHWLQVPDEKLERIQEASRSWITWSILFDDIQDDSSFRYGVPAAHRVFGVAKTINAANKTLVLLHKQMTDLGHPLAPKILMKRVENVLNGEGVDIHWKDKCECPPEEAHFEMTKNKAGGYFLLPVDLMQLFSSNKTDYTDLAIKIGTYYEMLDDYYNLFHPKALISFSNVKQEDHVLFSDITEGKITLAIIHASQFPDVATELADILKQKTGDPKLQNRVVSLLKTHGSDEYVRDKLRILEAEIREQIERLGGNPTLTVFINDLCFHQHEPQLQQEIY